MAGTGEDPAYTAGRYGDAAVTFAHHDEELTDEDDDAYTDEWTDEAGATPRSHDAHHNNNNTTTNQHDRPATGGAADAGVVNPAGGQGFQFHWTEFPVEEDDDHGGAPPPPVDPRTAGARHFAAVGGDGAAPPTPPAGHARGAGPHHGHHRGGHGGGHDAGHPMDWEDVDDEDEQMMDDEGQEGGGNFDEDYEPTDAEILDYCEWLGVDPTADRPLMWIVREALKAPLPEHWRLCYTDDRELYYFNVHTGESIWDHPLDAFYKALYKQEKAKLLKKRQCMRHFSGSLDLQPLAHFFSELGDDEGTPFDEVDSQSNTGAPSSSPPVDGATASRRPAPWAAIPEALIDAIDFRIFVEPVVLPTSGRTVSRHTIINTRWRDPFSREYVENRRLVPNVDKRAEVDAWLGNAVGHFFDHLEVSVAGLRRALRMLPYLLDKEEEMCLRGQRRFFDWIKRNHTDVKQQERESKAQESRSEAPSSARSSNAASEKPSRASASVRASGGAAAATNNATKNGTARKSSKARVPAPAGSTAARGAAVGAAAAAGNRQSGLGATQGSKTTPTTTPRRIPSILAMIEESLTDAERGSLVSALLTMATSTSRECLFYIVSNIPALAKHEAFKGFADEVLHMLYVGAPDLARIAQSIADTVAKRRDELAAAERSANDGTPAAEPSFGASTGPGMTSGAWGASWVAGQPPSVSNAAFQSSASAIGLGAANPSAPGSRGGDGVSVTANANNRATPIDLQAALFVSYGTSNSEQVSALQWVAGLQEHADANALSKLDFASMLHIVFAVSDSAQVAASGSTVTKLLRSATNWPTQLSQCPDEAIMKLYAVASTDEVPATRIRTLFDAAWSGGERCLEFFRQPDVRQSILDAMLELAPPASELSKAYGAGGTDGDQSADLFSAILVYHDCVSLEQLKCRPALALRVGYNLLPRLTRSQWRPKHFDTTVGTILSLTQQHPALAWRTMQSAGALFLLKELSKKKRNAEETRLKLGGLEAVERRHQQTNAINNWGLLASRLMRRTAKSVCELVSPSQDATTASAPTRAAPAAAAGAAAAGPSGRTRLPNVAPRPSPRGQAAKDVQRAPAPPPPPPAVPPGLQRIAAQVERYEANVARLSARREELHAERAQTIITALQTLVAMRLKPKASRLPAGSKKHGSTDEADRAGAVPPPISARRSSGSGRPPSGPSNGIGSRRVGGGNNEPGGVASSCPSLPPIAPTH